MNKLDLNIDNYELDDILNLFKIPKDFNEQDMKYAKKIVLQTHPDKSNLDSNIFRFYSKAYKILYSMWEFKNKTTKKDNNTEYDNNYSEFDEGKKLILNKFLSKNCLNESSNFNKWFNEQFENKKIQRDDESNGYGSWLRSSEDLDEEKHILYTQMGEEIEKKKRDLRSVIIHNGIDELCANYSGASNLTGDTPENYCSDLFSSLPYEDLKKAHTETVIPVTIEDYNNVKKFKSINEYNSYRNSQDTTPLSEIQAREYLSNKNKLQDHQTSDRAYKLAKEVEESNKKQQELWGSIMKLTN